MPRKLSDLRITPDFTTRVSVRPACPEGHTPDGEVLFRWADGSWTTDAGEAPALAAQKGAPSEILIFLPEATTAH